MLGIDENGFTQLKDRQEKIVETDSMILATVNKQNRMDMVSIPVTSNLMRKKEDEGDNSAYFHKNYSRSLL